jgi:hypothetical protein
MQHEARWANKEEKSMHSTEADIMEECATLSTFLVGKNLRYGDSALDPLRIFASSDAVEQIKVRIDDKLSRLARGAADDEDTVLDLLGYLVLLRIAQRREREQQHQESPSAARRSSSMAARPSSSSPAGAAPAPRRPCPYCEI